MIWSDDPRIEIFNEDCLPAMRRMKDNEFDLAITDPPYGIGADVKNSKAILQSKKSAALSNYYGDSRWDNTVPDETYFNELKRVSKKQIVWGANYFGIKGGMLFWDKGVTMPTYSAGEIAWLSWQNKIDYVKIIWHGMLQENMKNKEKRIHPTQKPVALYKWLLKNYTKPGDRILDTHLGSGSIAIACWDMGFSLTGYELDKDYFKAAHERFKRHIKQGVLFR